MEQGVVARQFSRLLPDWHSFATAWAAADVRSAMPLPRLSACRQTMQICCLFIVLYMITLDSTAGFDRLTIMSSAPDTMQQFPPEHWGIAPRAPRVEGFSSQNHRLVTVEGLLTHPEPTIDEAFLQDFAKISPQYPGVRAPLAPEVCAGWAVALSPLLDQWFGPYGRTWEMQAWYSIVTTPPAALQPIQCLPHVDGTDPTQVAMMLYLHRTGHGGTAFYRHRSTGLEALTAVDYPGYAAALQADVARTGLPPAAYPTDGAPHFDQTHVVPGTFNSAVFYRGNILHSGVIDNDAPLSADPREGRLTINAFIRPAAA